MRAGKIAAVAALGLGVMLLGGCEMLDRQQKSEPPGRCGDLHQRGRCDHGICAATHWMNPTTVHQNWKRWSSLPTWADYNSKHGENTIQVKSYEASDDGKVHLVMEYATANDYAVFNNVEFYSGSMINAQLEGYLFDGSFKKVKNGVVQGSAVSGSEVVKKMAAEVLVVTAPLEVHVPGNVLYTTSNAEVLASDDVNATGKTAEEATDKGLELPSKQVYIGEEKSFDEKAAARPGVYLIIRNRHAMLMFIINTMPDGCR